LTAHTGLVRNQHGLKLMYVNIGIYGQPRLTQSFDEEESSSNTVAEKIKTLEGYLREVKG